MNSEETTVFVIDDDAAVRDALSLLIKSIGLKPEDIIILQPTRMVKRKGIEYAIELIKALEDPRCKLVIPMKPVTKGLNIRPGSKNTPANTVSISDL